ncbi:MAG: hypothetical protein JXA97_01020 [Anaerolineales bacterium]|nr:hypothetical protein [Anaerolineales bacterium]
MALPEEIPGAEVLITVKAYPKPTGLHDDLVCTAGLYRGESWIRIHPVPYSYLVEQNRYPKYSWVRVDLIRNLKDFRPESYKLKHGLDTEFRVIRRMGTNKAWAARKAYVLRDVFNSMNDVIALAYGKENKSLAVLRPKEVVGFKIESVERQWRQSWQKYAKQSSFFDLDENGKVVPRKTVEKVPYKYSYTFLSEGDNATRTMMIEDWEIGALYWNCLKIASGDEEAANKLVKQKYLHEFVEAKDLYFFLGTTYRNHRKNASNPFIIIGVFYPPKTEQPLLL